MKQQDEEDEEDDDDDDEEWRHERGSLEHGGARGWGETAY